MHHQTVVVVILCVTNAICLPLCVLRVFVALSPIHPIDPVYNGKCVNELMKVPMRIYSRICYRIFIKVCTKIKEQRIHYEWVGVLLRFNSFTRTPS